MEHRRVPGLERTVSVLGVSLAPLVEGPPDRALGAPSIGFLRRARALGISVFDLDAGDGTRAAERALAGAFPRVDAELFLMCPLPAAAGRSGGPELSETVGETRRRVGGHPIAVLWVPGDRADELHGRFGELDALRTRRLIGGWGLAFDRPSRAVEYWNREEPGGPTLFRVPYSLLETGADRALRGRLANNNVGVIVTDPHAHGLLDGSLLEPGAPLPPTPSERREFERTARRLMRLAPITSDGQRSLPEAALQFALSPSSVVCALLSTRQPELLTIGAGALARAPIPPDLIRRVVAEADSGPEPAEASSPRAPSARPAHE